MRHKWFSGAGILLSLVLMALPCGVSVTFGVDAGQTLVQQYSYFSRTLIGSGNWFPLLAAAFTLLALVFLLLRRDYGQMAPICLGLSVASQVLAWTLFGAFTLISGVAAALQLAVLAQEVKSTWACRTNF